jgi:hypothetical protein
MRLTLALLVSLVSSPAFAQAVGEMVHARGEAPDGAGVLEDGDRLFLIAEQASTQAPGSLRLGTREQLEAVQGTGNGFLADVYADFAPTSWLTLGATGSYGAQDRGGSNEVSPTAYVKAQLLRQDQTGVNVAAEVQYKQVGFSPFEGDGEAELEGMLLADRRFGRVAVTADGVFGASLKGAERDAELKAAVGYYVGSNLLVGVDGLARLDLTPSDRQPAVGRSYELVGGPMATLKLDRLTLAALVGASAPMHVGTPGVGGVGMVHVGYAW